MCVLRFLAMFITNLNPLRALEDILQSLACGMLVAQIQMTENELLTPHTLIAVNDLLSAGESSNLI